MAADVKALAGRLALDECPNFNGFSSDIAITIKRYRFCDESLSMLRVNTTVPPRKRATSGRIAG
jgi:hypothetical protein